MFGKYISGKRKSKASGLLIRGRKLSTDAEKAQSASGLFLHQTWPKEIICDRVIDVIHINNKGIRFQPRLAQNQLPEYLANLEVFKPTGWLVFTSGN